MGNTLPREIGTCSLCAEKWDEQYSEYSHNYCLEVTGDDDGETIDVTYDSKKDMMRNRRDPVVLPCGHTMCRSCVLMIKEHSSTCPTCRTPFETYVNNYTFIEHINNLTKICREGSSSFLESYSRIHKIKYDKSCAPKKENIPKFPYCKCGIIMDTNTPAQLLLCGHSVCSSCCKAKRCPICNKKIQHDKIVKNYIMYQENPSTSELHAQGTCDMAENILSTVKELEKIQLH